MGRFPVWFYGVITREGNEIKLEIEPLDEQTANVLDPMWVGNHGYWAGVGTGTLLGDRSPYVTFINKEGILFYFFAPQEKGNSGGVPALVIKAEPVNTGSKYLGRYHLEVSYQTKDVSSLPANVAVYFEK